MTPDGVGILGVLANPRFRTLWVGHVISAVGDVFYLLAIQILVEKLTGSTAALGMTLIFTVALPQLLFGMPAGVLVDRWDRRRTMVAANVLRAVLVLGALAVTGPSQVWLLYIVGFLTSTVSRFYGPATMALIPSLVSEAELVTANSLSQMTMTVATLAGASLAGFVIGVGGTNVAFVVDAASFAFAAVAVWRIGPTVAAAGAAHVRRGLDGHFWHEVISGIRLFAQSRELRGILLTTAVVYLGLGAITTTWVPLLSRYYRVGALGMGVMYSIMGLGMVVGGLSAGRLAIRFSKSSVCAGGLLTIGVALALIGRAPNAEIIAVLAFLCAIPVIPVQATVATLAQNLTPDAARGRTFSAIYTVGQVTFLLSIAAAATVAQVVGIPRVYLGCGAIVVFAGIVFRLLVREPSGDGAAAWPEPAGLGLGGLPVAVGERITPDSLDDDGGVGP